MVKSKTLKKPAKVVKEVCPYASKEEEEEFLHFSSEEEENDSESSEEIQASKTVSKKKAFQVDMSDEEMASDDDDSGADDDKIQADEFDEDVDMDDVSDAEDEHYDRKDSRELTKFYSEQNERTVFVGNITPLVTTKVLIQLFNSKKAAGPEAVESVRIRGAVAKDESNNKHTKRRAIIQQKFKYDENQVLCAFVVLKKKEDVEKCLRLNNYEVCGRHLRVDVIKGKKMSYVSNNSVFIGNLPYDCNEEQVRDAFNKCGEIVNVRLVRSKLDGSIKGFGYVEFTESMGVDFAVKLSGKITVGDRKIRIEKWSGNQTQQQKRKMPNNNDTKKNTTVAKKRKIVIPTNMRSLELNEYIKSKQNKTNKKAMKKMSFIKDKKLKAKKTE